LNHNKNQTYEKWTVTCFLIVAHIFFLPGQKETGAMPLEVPVVVMQQNVALNRNTGQHAETLM
jgi:hypothetical protein